MKTYIIKDTCYEVENASKPHSVFYYGKDGYIHTDTLLVEGYKARRFAENRIKANSDGRLCIEIVPHVYIEDKRFVHFCEIIEIEK